MLSAGYHDLSQAESAAMFGSSRGPRTAIRVCLREGGLEAANPVAPGRDRIVGRRGLCAVINVRA
jgi:hypothetical protein